MMSLKYELVMAYDDEIRMQKKKKILKMNNFR